MILPRGLPGVAFGEATDGDPRSDTIARMRVSAELGISHEWAVVDQVHGADMVATSAPGHFGEADGMVTSTVGLPIAISTADCVPVVLLGDFTIVLLHAGWRGLAEGVVAAGVRGLGDAGDALRSAVIGPHIGACCYEVGLDVIESIGGYSSCTPGGAPTADLGEAVLSSLGNTEVISTGLCTMHNERFHSHRRNGTPRRQSTVVWIPQG